MGPKAIRGPYADQELSADVKLKESRGDLSLHYIKEEVPQEEIPQEEVSRLVKEAEDLQKEKETNTSNKPKSKRRKKKNG